MAISKNYSDLNLKMAHKFSSFNRLEISKSLLCICFHCQSYFAPSKVIDWTDDGSTAFCPICEVDSVLGNASSYPVEDPAFIREMHQYFFGEKSHVQDEKEAS